MLWRWLGGRHRPPSRRPRRTPVVASMSDPAPRALSSHRTALRHAMKLRKPAKWPNAAICQKKSTRPSTSPKEQAGRARSSGWHASWPRAAKYLTLVAEAAPASLTRHRCPRVACNTAIPLTFYKVRRLALSYIIKQPIQNNVRVPTSQHK
jgi:hypothetical protein